MNWNNIDLSDGYERDQHLIDPLTFSTLLLEVGCNCRVINEEAIKKQFEEDLQSRIEEARLVFNLNLANITKRAQSERSDH
tara:strand:+ start:339 stop:581 length:243 start_codon:yes stop_codon:yes gene_type:complete